MPKQGNTFRVQSMERLAKAPNGRPTIRVVFTVTGHSPAQELTVDVPVDGFDEADVVRVARHYLANQLEALAEAAKPLRLEGDGLKSLWTDPDKDRSSDQTPNGR